MRRTLTLGLVLGAAGIAASTYAVNVWATPPNKGYIPSTLAKGTFEDDLFQPRGARSPQQRAAACGLRFVTRCESF